MSAEYHMAVAMQAEKKRSERANKRMAERTIDAQRVSATIPRRGSVVLRAALSPDRRPTASLGGRSRDSPLCLTGTPYRFTNNCGSLGSSTGRRSGSCVTSTCRTLLRKHLCTRDRAKARALMCSSSLGVRRGPASNVRVTTIVLVSIRCKSRAQQFVAAGLHKC